jgi:hypothetical protein
MILTKLKGTLTKKLLTIHQIHFHLFAYKKPHFMV